MKKTNFLTKASQIQIGTGVSFQEKLLFTKHLATMIHAGIPMAEALQTLLEQTNSKSMKNILSTVIEQIKNGKSLTDALSEYPKVFDLFYTSLVQIGEKSGTLEESLDFLAKQLGKDYALRKKIQGALLYPGLVFFSTAIMGGFISLFVLPQLVDFFDAFDFPLPLPTKILLFVANVMKDYGIVIFAGIGLFFFGLSLFVKLKPIKPYWHAFLLKIPMIGKLIAYGQLARFTRNFGILLQSGLPVDQSLEITSKTMSNITYSQVILKLSQSLKKGESLHTTLHEKKISSIPPLVAKMIGVGEKTGNLDTSLLYLGNFYEDEIDEISKNLSTILEPILLLGIGLVVGFVALAIIGPIYELTGSIRAQ